MVEIISDNENVNLVIEKPRRTEPLDRNDDNFKNIETLTKEGKWPHSYLPGMDMPPYIKRLGKSVVGIEVGVAKGETSAWLLEKCPNLTKLNGVDPYLPYEDWCRYVDEEEINLQKTIAKENVSQYGDRFKFLETTAENAVKKFKKESVDFVFIDGDHSYNATLADFEMYYPLIKKGGILFGHDINLNTVKQAVTDFREKNKIRTPINLLSNSAFFWNK